MSNKSERDHLRSIGARVHKNSGRGMFSAGDGSDQIFVWDVKEANKSFALNQGVWNKICTDAYKVNKYKNPALMVVLGGKQKLAIIEIDVLHQLMEEYDEMAEKLREYDNTRRD